jgi:hypothetical protein
MPRLMTSASPVVELTVYANNALAIALCRKHRFTEAGAPRDWRRPDGASGDAGLMEKLLR